MYGKDRGGLLKILFLSVFLLTPVAVHACPRIDGLINFNCDNILKIAFVGDSIVTGVGDTTQRGGYVTRLRKRLNAKVTNDGVPGVTTGRLIRLIKSEFKQRKKSRYFRRSYGADIIIVDVGRNDYWSEVDPAITARNIRRIAKILQRKRVRKNSVAPYVIVANLLPTNRGFQASFIAQVNEYLNRLDGRSMSLDLDFYSMPRSLLADDGLHPTSAGYTWLSNLIENYVTGRLQNILSNLRPDLDSDGVYDIFEMRLFGTDPENPDSDGDGITDGEELFQLNTDPLDPLDPPLEEEGEDDSATEGEEEGDSDADGGFAEF